MNDNSLKVVEVDINEILPNRFQPRIQFDEDEILELSDSIKEHGVIQPIVVRSIGDKYEIIAGERRYKASVLAGKETVPVIIRNLNDKDSAEVALIENVQRKNLTPIEEAVSYKKVLDMGYLTQEQLAIKLGKSQSSIANKIRLLNLSDEVQEALLQNKISERHARSLLKLKDFKNQNFMLNRIISERLTVRRTDEEIEKMKEESSNEHDSQKSIEKGEINMNNNEFYNTNMGSVPTGIAPQPQAPSFDIFGTTPVAPQVPTMSAVPQAPSAPVMPTPSPVTTSVPSFDIFGTTPVAPEMPAAPTPVQPSVMPQQPALVPPVDLGLPQMNTTPAPEVSIPPIGPGLPQAGAYQPTPQVPTMSAAPQEPQAAFAPQQINPTIPGVQYDGTGIVNTPEPTQTPAPQMPTGLQFDENGVVISAAPIGVPATAPIMESAPTQVSQQSDNLFSFGPAETPSVTPAPQSTPAVSEVKLPEPIIITDYTKQYDPVMPQTNVQPTPQVDLKTIIALIRDCSSKIENYGFKIDVEEIDLQNMYQVTFKIQK